MRKYLFLMSCSLTVSAPAMAQVDGWDGPDEENIILPIGRDCEHEITVLATGQRLHVSKVGQSISVMGREEIEAVQGPDLARVFERLPGVMLARNGSLGGFTGLFVRGASSQQVLVMVDGVRVADAGAPSGGYDFGNLMTGPVGKVELLRGSNSVVWGSDAIGGVISLTSREVKGIEGSAEYGARNTVNGEVTGGIADNRGNSVSVSAGYTETAGFSQAASGSEPDRFRQYRVGARGDMEVAQNVFARFAGRYADSRVDFDGFDFSPPFGLVDTPEFTLTEEFSASAGLGFWDGMLGLDAVWSIYDISRDNFDPRFGSEPSFASDGRQQRIDLSGRWGFNNRVRLDFGASRQWSRFETNFDEPAKAGITSGHLLLGWYGTEGLTVAAGARIDDHSGFGSEWTFGANGSYEIAHGWRLRASYGEGFKAPTLYQLYSDYGDASLVPESSKSYDIGIERGDRNGGLHLAFTLFRRDSRNLIDFASCTGSQCTTRPYGLYQNVGRARAQGVEIELGARVSENLRAQAAYTWMKAKDRTPGGFNQGNDLARRPRHAVTVSLDWETPLAGLALGADLRMVGKSFDDAGNFTRLDSYATGTLRVSLPVTEKIELFGRVENVTDADYLTVAGYNTAGRSAYVGARARF